MRFVLLHGARELLTERIIKRRCHLMPASMLDSQVQTPEPLQPDKPGFTLNIAKTPEELATDAAASLPNWVRGSSNLGGFPFCAPDAAAARMAASALTTRRYLQAENCM